MRKDDIKNSNDVKSMTSTGLTHSFALQKIVAEHHLANAIQANIEAR